MIVYRACKRPLIHGTFADGSSNTVSQIITSTVEQGLVKNDPNAPDSKRYARYIPAWA